MALYKKLDISSIYDGLDTMINYCISGNKRNSPYWDYYYEQINDLCTVASNLIEELNTLVDRLWYQLPARKIAFCEEDASGQGSISWFNTAAAMLSDTDMAELLERENIYLADELKEKQKRINALNRLTKKQQMLLYTEVIGFITRYLELSAAFDTIQSVIDELDYHQAAVAREEKFTLPQAAHV